MLIVFCSNPLNVTTPDPHFQAEVDAAQHESFDIAYIDHDAVTRGHVDRMLRPLRRELSEPTLAVYRGWMLTVEQYTLMYNTLRDRNIILINTPGEYRTGHHLPEWYHTVNGQTPKSVWVDTDATLDKIMESISVFGNNPLVLKDFVKSRKHEWDEACYIASAADADAVSRVVNRFKELQDDCLTGGLVFREFVEFQTAGIDRRTRRPLTLEFRLFWLNGQPIGWFPHQTSECYTGKKIDTSRFTMIEFQNIALRLGSRFISMDIALQHGIKWMIVEIGDGQVSEVAADEIPSFYMTLSAAAKLVAADFFREPFRGELPEPIPCAEKFVKTRSVT